MVMSIGQLFALAGSMGYRDPPSYRKGHLSAFGLEVGCLVTTLVIYFYLQRMNVKKRAWLADAANVAEAEQKRAHGFDVVGDAHPDFFYTL